MLVQVIREMDLVEKVVREACARSPDGKITPLDFTNHASRTMRYGTFSPMEVAIIFHYARQGLSPEDKPRLGIRDFGSLLDAKWGPPRVTEPGKGKSTVAGSAMHEIGKASRFGCAERVSSDVLLTPRFGFLRLQSAYYFGLGGIAGALGATAVYPIDLTKVRHHLLIALLRLGRRGVLSATNSSPTDSDAEPAIQGCR